MADQEEPDHTEDPRGEDTGQGYPETQPDGATPGSEEGPGSGTDPDHPDRSSTKDADREASTGNPGAAGA